MPDNDDRMVVETPPPVADDKAPSTEPKTPAEQFDNTLDSWRRTLGKDKKKDDNKNEDSKTTDKAKDDKADKKNKTEPGDEQAKEKAADKGAQDDSQVQPKSRKKSDPGETDKEPDDARRVRRTVRTPKRDASRADDITRTAAETAAATVAKLTEQSKKDAAKAPVVDEIDPKDLPQDLALEMRVLGELETLDDKHKGAKAKLVGWIRDLGKYQAKWQADHPGETYNSEDEEHDAIYDRKPTIDPDDLELGKVSMAQKRLKNPQLEKLETENRRLKADFAEQKTAPIVANETNRAVHHVLKSIDPTYVKYMESADALGKLPDEDPIAADILGQVLNPADAKGEPSPTGYMPFVREVVRLYDSNGDIPFNGQDPVHQEIINFALKMEKAVGALPMEKQVRDGRAFATMVDYDKMTKEERADHWSFAEKDNLINFRLSEAIQQAHGLLETEKKRMAAYEKRFGKKESAATDTAPAKEEPKPEKKPTKVEAEPPPPGTPGRSAVDTVTNGKPTKPTDFSQKWLNRMFE